MESKKGQLALWVILAIALVGSMMLYFTLSSIDDRPGSGIGTGSEFSPDSYIVQCVKLNIDEAVDVMLPRGGFLDPKNTKQWKNINVSYHCKSDGNYNTCINQHPVLINEMEKEIENYLEPKLEDCFVSLKGELERKNWNVNIGDQEFSVELGNNRIFVNIDREVSLSKGDESQKIENFEIELISPAYNLASVASEIASQESKNCYFEHVGYMVIYPRFDIRRDVLEESTEIYSIKDKQSNKVMNIAIRSCAIPPGI